MKRGLGASWFISVGWEGPGKAQTGSQECCGNGLGRPKMKHGCVLHGSQAWGGKGLGRLKTKHEFRRVGWEGFGKAQNEAWRRVWVLHGSHEWGGKGLGSCKIKYEKGFGCEGSGKAKNEAWKGGWVLHGSHEWGGAGLGRFKMKHEKGVGYFVVPKSWVGRVWEGSKNSMRRGLGVSWFRRVGWEGLGKAKNKAWKGVWVFLMAPKNNLQKMKSGMGRKPWSTELLCHASFLAFPNQWHPTVGVKTVGDKSVGWKVYGCKVCGWQVYGWNSCGWRVCGWEFCGLKLYGWKICGWKLGKSVGENWVSLWVKIGWVCGWKGYG